MSKKNKPKHTTEDTTELMQKYIDKHGVNNVQNVWKILERNEPFVEAMKTSVGQQMYKDVMDMAGKAKNEYEGRLMSNTDLEKLDMPTVRALISFHTYMNIIKIYDKRMETYLKLKI